MRQQLMLLDEPARNGKKRRPDGVATTDVVLSAHVAGNKVVAARGMGTSPLAPSPPLPTASAGSSRARDLHQIAAALADRAPFVVGSSVVVAAGDSLALLRKLPDRSVSLILTDPPYHATKKHNIYGDRSFADDRKYLDWMALYVVEWRRVLRTNGSLLCFCDSSMSARLEVLLSGTFNVLSHVVWTKPNDLGFDGWKGKMKKEALRQWYPHSERILFAEPAVAGNLGRSPFAQFLREMRIQSGLSAHTLTATIGAYGKVNHGGAVSNWETGRNTPSREQYDGMCRAFLGTGNVAYMPPYEDVVRSFTMDGSKEFTDVWTFPSVRPYSGKHPAEKPAALLEHAIEAATFPGDVVLDCFGGSGGTAIAALKLGRRAVVMEIEQTWVDRIVARVRSVYERRARNAGALISSRDLGRAATRGESSPVVVGGPTFPAPTVGAPASKSRRLPQKARSDGRRF